MGLDVFEDEPAMKPGLAECENAVIVPHIASASLWTRSGMVHRPRPRNCGLNHFTTSRVVAALVSVFLPA